MLRYIILRGTQWQSDASFLRTFSYPTGVGQFNEILWKMSQEWIPDSSFHLPETLREQLCATLPLCLLFIIFLFNLVGDVGLRIITEILSAYTCFLYPMPPHHYVLPGGPLGSW